MCRMNITILKGDLSIYRRHMKEDHLVSLRGWEYRVRLVTCRYCTELTTTSWPAATWPRRRGRQWRRLLSTRSLEKCHSHQNLFLLNLSGGPATGTSATTARCPSPSSPTWRSTWRGSTESCHQGRGGKIQPLFSLIPRSVWRREHWTEIFRPNEIQFRRNPEFPLSLQRREGNHSEELGYLFLLTLVMLGLEIFVVFVQRSFWIMEPCVVTSRTFIVLESILVKAAGRSSPPGTKSVRTTHGTVRENLCTYKFMHWSQNFPG